MTAMTGHTITPLLSPDAVAERLGVSVTTLWRMRNAGDFPQPILIGKRSKRWRAEDVEAYLQRQDQARPPSPA